MSFFGEDRERLNEYLGYAEDLYAEKTVGDIDGLAIVHSIIGVGLEIRKQNDLLEEIILILEGKTPKRNDRKFMKKLMNKNPISELNFSNRVNNALIRYKVETIGDVFHYMESGDLFIVRNLGDKGIAEITEKMQNYYKDKESQ